MHTIPSLPKLLRRLAPRILLLPFLFGSMLAQSGNNGTITGRVYDDTTGRSLQGAVVTVRGTNHQDYTDPEGRFTLPGVAAGSATLEIEYVGLDHFTQSVSVSAGTTAMVSAGLKSSVLQLEAFEVKEAVRGQALAINQQKTAAGIVNIVSEEVFGNMIGGNPGYALQRLPGISVDEDQDGQPTAVNLRGVPGELNSFQVDGIRLPNSGGTSRAADMRSLVADGITNIEVMKAVTPDRDGDAVGGIINVVSRNAFQRDGREYKLVGTASYNDLSGTWGYNARASFSDIFGVMGQEKNLGISFTATKYRTDRYSENADIDWVRVTAANNPQLNLTGNTKFLEASHAERAYKATNTWGFNGSIDFRLNPENSFYFRPYYSHYDQTAETFETDWDIDTRFQDNVGGRKTYAFLAPDGSEGRGTPGPNGSRSTLGYIGTDNDTHNDLWSWTFGGRHEKDTTRLTYDFNYSTSTNVQPNFAEYNLRLDPITAGYYVMEYSSANRLRPQITIINGLSPTDFAYARQGPTNLILRARTKEEEVYSGKIDWEKKFAGERASHTLKLGAKYRSSKPTFEQEQVSYRVVGNAPAMQTFPFAQVTRPATGVLNSLGIPRYMEALPKEAKKTLGTVPWEAVQPGSFNNSNLPDYNAEENTTALYVMDTFKFGRHSVIGGLRWEQNDFSRENKRVITTATPAGNVYSTAPVKSSAKYDLWLPGVHFRHELAKNLILRESYNKSYGRPSLTLISRGRQESVATSGVITITEGNPNLQPLESDNYDIQLEWYNDKGGLYSIALFMKDMKNFTFTQVTRWNTLDANGRPVPVANGNNIFNEPLNGPGAKNKGIELIARQRLYFLPGPLKGLSADVSATFTESKAQVPGREGDDLPLEGFSDYLFTSSLSYAWGNFRARVDYRYRAAYIEGLDDAIDTDEWFSAREQVDAEMSYRFTKNLSVFASGTNLTHTPQVSYTGQPQFPEDVSYSGRKYQFGVEYKF
ncbi:MAG: TonB-dependent receptor [Opitutaceae bacterium]|nr:TonB-dependent receptor [Opitutaceae bacterium]